MVRVPSLERGSIDQDDAVFDESVGSDQLVVRGVVDDVDDSGLLSDCFARPVEVAFLEPESPELVVPSPDPDMPHPLINFPCGEIQLRVGDWSSLFEGPLLLVDGHSATGEPLLVPRVSIDSHGSEY